MDLTKLSDQELEALDLAIELERQRRDVCEHYIRTGEWCQKCNDEYKAARRENGDSLPDSLREIPIGEND